jgi:hypothetical protein
MLEWANDGYLAVMPLADRHNAVTVWQQCYDAWPGLLTVL